MSTFDRTTDHGPEGEDAEDASYGAELDRIQSLGFELIRCSCSHGCWQCRGHGWVLPARESAKRWDDGGASEAAEEAQLVLPGVAREMREHAA